MMAFIDQEASEKAEEIDAKVNYRYFITFRTSLRIFRLLYWQWLLEDLIGYSMHEILIENIVAICTVGIFFQKQNNIS